MIKMMIKMIMMMTKDYDHNGHDDHDINQGKVELSSSLKKNESEQSSSSL